MSDFSDRPLVAGSLIGARAFDVDALGRLTGPTYRNVFTPGENVAKCLTGSLMSLSGYITALSSAAEESTPTPKHVVGTTGCSCGYYAYFDGRSDYSETGRVTALIEGYGVCSVGSRGFRAEKARLVALVDPHSGRRTHPEWYDRLADWLDRHGNVAGMVVVLGGFLSLFAGISGIALTVEGSPLLGLPMSLLAGVAGIGCVVVGRADFHGISRQYRSIHPELACHDGKANRFGMVARNYPGVPVYRSLGAAVAAHPLTAPEPPPTPSPDDADFWTRGAQ